jgi:hypothetical protein
MCMSLTDEKQSEAVLSLLAGTLHASTLHAPLLAEPPLLQVPLVLVALACPADEHNAGSPISAHRASEP